jgi:hypothetical protein
MLRIRLRNSGSCAAALPGSSEFLSGGSKKQFPPSRNLLIYGYSVIFSLMQKTHPELHGKYRYNCRNFSSSFDNLR